ncbi:hypothetical protein [Actinokineospora globicatena]|uniref:CdiI C-terminal domain-containing protein n=1 Tax=Actinokineospora globicatena TaxID=103729 RepID=A0A9W6QK98_9PSEU|nr:hypothetical protein [Actinokineospora globicatena]GLW91215.1 hypothetical protein Aglo03_20310 [Actinokineospora globicatena]
MRIPDPAQASEFSIDVLDDDGARPASVTGCITIGESREYFQAPLDYWGLADYRRSWSVALRKLVDGELATSCLLVSVTDPASANFIGSWPLYREGEQVFLQERLIFMDQLDAPFDIDRPWLSIDPRETVNEDGMRISEWTTDIQSIRDFLSSHLP